MADTSKTPSIWGDWFHCPPDAWGKTREDLIAAGVEFSTEQRIADLRWWDDQIRMGRAQTMPGARRLAREWGCSHWIARQHKKDAEAWRRPDPRRTPAAHRRTPAAHHDKEEGGESGTKRTPAAHPPHTSASRAYGSETETETEKEQRKTGPPVSVAELQAKRGTVKPRWLGPPERCPPGWVVAVPPPSDSSSPPSESPAPSNSVPTPSVEHTPPTPPPAGPVDAAQPALLQAPAPPEPVLLAPRCLAIVLRALRNNRDRWRFSDTEADVKAKWNDLLKSLPDGLRTDAELVPVCFDFEGWLEDKEPKKGTKSSRFFARLSKWLTGRIAREEAARNVAARKEGERHLLNMGIPRNHHHRYRGRS